MDLKVLVGCPTSDYHEYCLKDYVDIVKNLSYKNYNVVLVDNSKDLNYYKKIKELGLKVVKTKYFESARDRIIASRNILRKIALNKGYDYLLSLEQDVIPPTNVIESLIRHNKEIVSGVYFGKFVKNVNKYFPLLWIQTSKDKMYPISEVELNNPRLIEVHKCGLGCVLIHRNVLEKIEFRYEKQLEAFDDIHFSNDARKNGFKIYADTSVVCKHLVLNRPWDWKEMKV